MSCRSRLFYTSHLLHIPQHSLSLILAVASLSFLTETGGRTHPTRHGCRRQRRAAVNAGRADAAARGDSARGDELPRCADGSRAEVSNLALFFLSSNNKNGIDVFRCRITQASLMELSPRDGLLRHEAIGYAISRILATAPQLLPYVVKAVRRFQFGASIAIHCLPLPVSSDNTTQHQKCRRMSDFPAATTAIQHRIVCSCRCACESLRALL